MALTKISTDGVRSYVYKLSHKPVYIGDIS